MWHKVNFFVEFNRIWIQSFPSLRQIAIARVGAQSALLFTDSWKKNSWIHTFPKNISKLNTKNLIQDFNSGHCVSLLQS